jgi:hypothetical protein
MNLDARLYSICGCERERVDELPFAHARGYDSVGTTSVWNIQGEPHEH